MHHFASDLACSASKVQKNGRRGWYVHAYWRFGCAKTFKGVSPEREYVVKNGLRV